MRGKRIGRYELFDSFLVRTTLFGYNNLEALKGGNIDFPDIHRLFDNAFVQEAIFIASPSFYYTLIGLEHKNSYTKKESKALISFYKYYLRMCSRPTPFGLFSGIGTGVFGDQDHIELPIKNHYTKNYQVSYPLIEEIKDKIQIGHLLDKMVLWANTSIYEFDNSYRFTTGEKVDGKYTYGVEAVAVNPILEHILQLSKNGVNVHRLVESLVKFGHERKEIEAFIWQLLDIGFLYIQKENCLTEKGIKRLKDYFSTTKDYLQDGAYLEEFFKIFEELPPLENGLEEYRKIQSIISSHITAMEKPSLQVDSVLNTLTCTLDKNRKNSLYKAIDVLLKIGNTNQNHQLNKFKERFSNRYETAPIRLVDALDVDYGLGYPIDRGKAGFEFNDLLEWPGDVSSEDPKGKVGKNIGSSLRQILMNNAKSRKFELSEDDINTGSSEPKTIPPTFSVFVEFLIENGQEYIYVPGISGGTALRTVGRFAQLDSGIDSIIDEVVRFEDSFWEGKIPFEVIHNPGGDIGNVLARPNNRKHRLSYLEGDCPNKGNIPIDDIYISVRGHDLVLTLGAKGQQLIPYFSTAHNLSQNSNPVYRFLGDFVHSYGFSYVGLDIPSMDMEGFYPRITFKNIIFFKAKWTISSAKIMDTNNIGELKNYLELINVDKMVSLVEGDNILPLDLTNDTSLILLKDNAKKNHFVLLEEVIPFQKVISRGKQDYHKPEFVFLFKNLENAPSR